MVDDDLFCHVVLVLRFGKWNETLQPLALTGIDKPRAVGNAAAHKRTQATERGDTFFRRRAPVLGVGGVLKEAGFRTFKHAGAGQMHGAWVVDAMRQRITDAGAGPKNCFLCYNENR
jgi:hypothetical protein